MRQRAYFWLTFCQSLACIRPICQDEMVIEKIADPYSQIIFDFLENRLFLSLSVFYKSSSSNQ